MEEKNLGKILNIIARKDQRAIGIVMKEIGITGTEYVFLVNIPKEGITQQEICRDFEVDPAFATRGVKSLLEKGYINKVKSERDGRAYTLHLTGEGEKKKEEVRERLKRLEGIINGDMTREEIEEMYNSLLKIKERLGAYLEKGEYSE